jgi:CubicO group peptidase (beta-lactamase class C family)
VTRYLPELVARDPKFRRITLRDLLTMTSVPTWLPMRGSGVDKVAWLAAFGDVADQLTRRP